MHTGHYISGGAHGVLILWALFGGVFRSDPPEVQVADVSVISEAQFAAMMQPQAAPALGAEPVALPQPEAPEPTPAPPVAETAPVARPDPVPQPVEPLPEPPVAEELPQPPAPEPVPEVDAPDVALRPVPRPAPRVAAEVVPEPEPEAEVGPEVQETVEPAETPDVTEAEEQQATAPEAAATEIVTEAEQPARAPTASTRPQVRPNRPAPTETETAAAPPAPQETAPQEPVADATASAIAGALQEALAGSATGTADGPPLTSGERDGFRLAVQDCWVVDVGSQASNVTVTVGFEMDRSGRVVATSMQMLAASGGDGSAAETAYQAARRAILRCQGDGYTLPPEKFDQWKAVEMTFNPESMRIR